MVTEREMENLNACMWIKAACDYFVMKHLQPSTCLSNSVLQCSVSASCEVRPEDLYESITL